MTDLGVDDSILITAFGPAMISLTNTFPPSQASALIFNLPFDWTLPIFKAIEPLYDDSISIKEFESPKTVSTVISYILLPEIIDVSPPPALILPMTIDYT